MSCLIFIREACAQTSSEVTPSQRSVETERTVEAIQIGMISDREHENSLGTRRRPYCSCRIVAAIVFSVLSVIAIGLGAGLSRKFSNTGPETTESAAFSFGSTVQSRQYTYLSYDQIVQRLFSLQATYPNLVEIYTAQDRYSLPSAGYCMIDGYTQPCKV